MKPTCSGNTPRVWAAVVCLALGANPTYGEDCNSNGVDDAQDIASLTSQDCQPNGIPDECELAGNDCNADGRPDECGVEDACLGDHPTEAIPLNSSAVPDRRTDVYPQFATDGEGNWVAVWQSNDDYTFTIGLDDDILYARSSDNGATWSDVAPLNTDAATDFPAGDYAPRIATDGQGTWLAVWTASKDASGGAVSSIDILFASSTDNGITWSAPALLSPDTRPGASKTHPEIATDRAGHWIAVWSSASYPSGGSGDAEIIVSTSEDNGATWSFPSILNGTSGNDPFADDMDPDIVTDGQGTWLAGWHGVADEGANPYKAYVYVSWSTDNGATWSTPEFPYAFDATQRDRDYGVSLATDEAGTWVAAWSHMFERGRAEDIWAVRSTDGGVSWDAPVGLTSILTTGEGKDLEAQLATDRQGNWYAVWQHIPPDWPPFPPEEVYFSRSDDHGASWTLPTAFEFTPGADGGAPQIASDEHGEWLAIWHSNEELGGITGTDYDIVASRFETSGPDCNCNGVPDACENDCNCNGVDDGDDIALATSEDCNLDAIPDECQVLPFVDCDGNLINDACDLVTATHPDCNENAVPDSCDIADDTSIDCNSNGIPDSCDVANSTSPDENNDGVPDECCPPAAAAPVAVVPLGSRYISLTQVGEPGVAHALRVRLVALDGFAAHEDYLWVAAPRAYPDEVTSQPGQTMTAARLDCTPHYRDWSTIEVLHIFGGDITPMSEYEIQLIAAGCESALTSNWSQAVTTQTGSLGDVVAPFFDPVAGVGQPDFLDVAAAVQKFLALPGAPKKRLAQVLPNTVKPSEPLNFKDIAAYVLSFVGEPYADMPDVSGPCACPSGITCGSTPCLNDGQCATGLCFDGFCHDACGRCAP